MMWLNHVVESDSFDANYISLQLLFSIQLDWDHCYLKAGLWLLINGYTSTFDIFSHVG